MKRLLTLILALFMMFAFAGCGEETSSEKKPASEEIMLPYYDEDTGKYGFCTPEGENRIDPSFDEAVISSEKGIAVVCSGGMCGLVNTNGDWVVKPTYRHWPQDCKNGLFVIVEDSENGDLYGLMDSTGKILVKPQYDAIDRNFQNGMTRIVLDDKWGYMDESGNVVVEPQFVNVEQFGSNGLAPVRTEDGKCGFINKSGEWVIEPKFEGAGAFASNGLARAADENGLDGYINESGEWVLEPYWPEAYAFTDDGLAIVSRYSKYGFINEKGEYLFEPEYYQSVRPFKNGLAFVNYHGKVGYINEKGEFEIELKFDSHGDRRWIGNGKPDFSDNGLALVYVKDKNEKHLGKFGYIDKTGEFIIDLQFDEAWEFGENPYARVEIDGKTHYINEKGEIIAPKN